LEYLNRIKPTDGWSIQQAATTATATRDNNSGGGGGSVRLFRRNVPLTDNFFLDIHYDSGSKQVVGVMTKDGSTCQVLLDPSCRPLQKNQHIIVATKNYPVSEHHGRSGSGSGGGSSGRNTRSSTTAASPGAGARVQTAPGVDLFGNLSPTERQDVEMYLKYALIAIVGMVVIRALAVSSVVFVLAFPLLYLYGVTTCPPMDSFDPKKELKRVLRGQHLPDDHPSKPKGMLEQWAARITASVTTELATFPGYEISMMPIAGAAIWTEVKVPTANLQAYWVGANHRWYYVGSREIEQQPLHLRHRQHQD
jgi:hypothetical protein